MLNIEYRMLKLGDQHIRYGCPKTDPDRYRAKQ